MRYFCNHFKQWPGAVCPAKDLEPAFLQHFNFDEKGNSFFVKPYPGKLFRVLLESFIL